MSSTTDDADGPTAVGVSGGKKTDGVDVVDVGFVTVAVVVTWAAADGRKGATAPGVELGVTVNDLAIALERGLFNVGLVTLIPPCDGAAMGTAAAEVWLVVAGRGWFASGGSSSTTTPSMTSWSKSLRSVSMCNDCWVAAVVAAAAEVFSRLRPEAVRGTTLSALGALRSLRNRRALFCITVLACNVPPAGDVALASVAGCGDVAVVAAVVRGWASSDRGDGCDTGAAGYDVGEVTGGAGGVSVAEDFG